MEIIQFSNKTRKPKTIFNSDDNLLLITRTNNNKTQHNISCQNINIILSEQEAIKILEKLNIHINSKINQNKKS